MERISKRQKKLALLYGRLEMDGLLTGKDSNIQLAGDMATFTRRQLEQWRDGGKSNIGYRQLSNLIAKHFDIRDNAGNIIEHDIIDGSMGPNVFGRHIGLKAFERQYFIDQLYGRLLPTMPMLTMDATVSDKFMRDYGGFYTMYRIDYDDAKGMFIVQIPISIRYALNSTKSGATDLARIRCKASVPRTKNRKPDFFKYDGWVAHSNEAWY